MSRKATYQENLKADILYHTLTLAGEEGWAGVSTRKIADRLQTSTTAIYHYFGGKEAILVELQREGFRHLQDDQLTALARYEGKPKKQLKAVSLAMLRFAQENPDRYALMFNLDGVVCHSDASVEAGDGMKQTKAVLKQLSHENIESVYMHWFAMMHGFVTLVRQRGHLDQSEDQKMVFENLLKEAIDRFIKGL